MLPDMSSQVYSALNVNYKSMANTIIINNIKHFTKHSAGHGPPELWKVCKSRVIFLCQTQETWNLKLYRCVLGLFWTKCGVIRLRSPWDNEWMNEWMNEWVRHISGTGAFNWNAVYKLSTQLMGWSHFRVSYKIEFNIKGLQRPTSLMICHDVELW